MNFLEFNDNLGDGIETMEHDDFLSMLTLVYVVF